MIYNDILESAGYKLQNELFIPENFDLINESLFGRMSTQQYNPNGKSLTRIYTECCSVGSVRLYMDQNDLENIKISDKFAKINSETFYGDMINYNPNLKLQYKLDTIIDPDDDIEYVIGVLYNKQSIIRLDLLARSQNNKEETWFICFYEIGNTSPDTYRIFPK